jgi:DNA-binding transcriptional MocR family regulator
MLVQTYITGETSVNIARSIEDAVAAGRAAAGTQVPPVRVLAAHLRVSPATVSAAYRLLKDRGVLVTDGRRGTRVRHAAPLATPAEAPLPEGARDLASGNPDLTLLPDFAKAMKKVVLEQRLYRDDLNDPELLALAKESFEADRVPGAHVAVVSGALDGIERVLREHLRAGDRVAVEDPCFTGVLDLLNALALVAVPVPVDDHGLVPAALRRTLKSCRALVVTPRAQNPFGSAHVPKRARELRSILATRPDLLLVEDDHAGPIAGTPYLTLVDPARRSWAVVRSVSKSLGPDLRVALLASDPRTHARVEGRQTLGIRWVSHILQRLVVALWRDPAPARAARAYASRREALLRALASHNLPAHASSGLNVWIPVPEEASVVQALLHRGWAVKAAERYRLATPPAIRVTIADLAEKEAVEFAGELARIVRPSRNVTMGS